MNTRYSTRSAWIGIALIALAFLAGAAAGAAVDRYLHRGMTVRTRIVHDMSGVLDQLGLTAAQRTEAQAILDRSTPRSREIMLEVGARLQVISDSVDGELRSILTPEQRFKLDSLRRPAKLVLRRKDPSGATSVDTVYPLPER